MFFKRFIFFWGRPYLSFRFIFLSKIKSNWHLMNGHNFLVNINERFSSKFTFEIYQRFAKKSSFLKQFFFITRRITRRHAREYKTCKIDSRVKSETYIRRIKWQILSLSIGWRVSTTQDDENSARRKIFCTRGNRWNTFLVYVFILIDTFSLNWILD